MKGGLIMKTINDNVEIKQDLTDTIETHIVLEKTG